MAGSPPSDVRGACAEILEQYSLFEGQTLAVRGESLQLSRTRWANDAGFETNYLHVIETDNDGRICYYGRFDEDDFEGAYRELERRYYVGENATFAQAGLTVTEYAIAMNRREFDRAFGELSASDFRLENRSRSGFGDRSLTELRTTYEDLTAMMASTRIWHSAICWLSPTVAVGRFEREAVGIDGERYAWSLIDAAEIVNGRLAAACQFELEDEQAAFDHAADLVRASASRGRRSFRRCGCHSD